MGGKQGEEGVERESDVKAAKCKWKREKKQQNKQRMNDERNIKKSRG